MSEEVLFEFGLIDYGTEVSWALVVREYKQEVVEKMADRFSESMAIRFLTDVDKKGFSHFTLEQSNKYLFKYISNVMDHLSDGRILIMNRKGGICFLDEKFGTKLLDSKFSTYFGDWPYEVKEDMGLIGWLDPDGTFYPCKHGKHHIKAQELVETIPQMDQNKFIAITSAGKGAESLSHITIFEEPTEQQKEWFRKNYKWLDKKQKELALKEKLIE